MTAIEELKVLIDERIKDLEADKGCGDDIRLRIIYKVNELNNVKDTLIPQAIEAENEEDDEYFYYLRMIKNTGRHNEDGTFYNSYPNVSYFGYIYSDPERQNLIDTFTV